MFRIKILCKEIDIYSYESLSDVEFEELCKDIMAKKLSCDNLRTFAQGKDGGIDITDSTHEKNYLLQVKHYCKSPIFTLISNLKDEKTKIDKLQPKQYFICCSRELTPQNVEDLFLYFKEYMKSDENIVTIKEIEDFLHKEENASILKKHIKLWLNSTSILQDMLSHDMTIDSETLFNSIKEDEKVFVKTQLFHKCIKGLREKNVLLILGAPGVGKTTTSKMLLMYFMKEGYKLRYTSNNNIADIKKSLSQSPEIKEFVFLDDCLGQAYFNLKETQPTELSRLIDYVSQAPNKKLLLNSRVTIYNEANTQATLLQKSLNRENTKIEYINMDEILAIEKARIFYNHLYFSEIPHEYLASIKEHTGTAQANYLKIVRHKNYNLRVIEFVTTPQHYSMVDPVNYFTYIMDNLDKPTQIWENEYKHRIQPEDRILLTTLYSLNDNTVSIKLLEESFNQRIKDKTFIDKSKNPFENAMKRLNHSFINTIDKDNKEYIKVINPSVNDFLKSNLSKNIVEKDDILKNKVSVAQIHRMLPEEEARNTITDLLRTNEIFNYVFEKDKENAIACLVVEHGVLDLAYKDMVQNYVASGKSFEYPTGKRIFYESVFEKFLKKEMYSFYELSTIIEDFAQLDNILSFFLIEDVIRMINSLDEFFDYQDKALEFIKVILADAIKYYFENLDVSSFDISVSKYVKFHINYDGDHENEVDTDAIQAEVTEQASSFIAECLQNLPEKFEFSEDFYSNIKYHSDGIDDLVESYLNSTYDDDGEYFSGANNDSAIHALFNR